MTDILTEVPQKAIEPAYVLPCSMDSIGRVLIPAFIRNKYGFTSSSNFICKVIDGNLVIEKQGI